MGQSLCAPCINCKKNLHINLGCSAFSEGIQQCCKGCGSCYTCCSDTCQLDCSLCGLSTTSCLSCFDCEYKNPCYIIDKQNTEIAQVLSEFTVREDVDDKWFGEAKLIEHNTSKEFVILKEDEYFLESAFNAHCLQFEQRQKLQHQNIVQLRFFSTRPEETFCATFHKSFLFFDYILTDLEHEFQERLAKQLNFTEEEIWKLVEGSIQGLEYLYSNNIDHGALKLQNIYINPKGVIKVADPPLFSYTDNYNRIFQDRDEHSDFILLSPELLHALDKNIKNPIYDKQKSDVFTLGMILLQVGTMRQSKTCYDYDQAFIFQDKIDNNLEFIKGNYHDSFHYLVKEMLNETESQRPNFKQLCERLERIPKAKQAFAGMSDTVIAPQRQAPLQIDVNYSNYPIQSIYMDQNKSAIQSQPKTPDYANYDHLGGAGLDQTYGLGQDYSNPLYGTNALINHFDILGPSAYGGMSQMDAGNKESIYINSIRKPKFRHKYQGQKKGGLKNGKGRFINEDGSYYDGNWKDNKMNGKGALYDNNGKVVYDGSFKEDQYHGHGTKYNSQSMPILAELNPKQLQSIDQIWTKYEGDFKLDKRDGFGTLIFSNGDKYVGAFKNDMINGHGTFIKKNGQKIQGIWNQGTMK